MKLEKIPNKRSYYLTHHQHSTPGTQIERNKVHEQ